MFITAAILLDVLERDCPIARYGRRADDLLLNFPVFYEKNMPLRRGGLYIAKSSDLPQSCDVPCLSVCIGRRPSGALYRWGGEVFVADAPQLDLLTLFNRIQMFFGKVVSWGYRMQELLEREADLKEYVVASVELFGNGITITDYNLQILVNCAAVEREGRRELAIDTQFDRVPAEISAEFKSMFLQSNSVREPFIYTEQRGNPTGDNYCINLYLGDTYVGCCTLYDCMKPMRQSDFTLFQVFADYIRRAMTKLSVLNNSHIVTIKTIFSSILQAFPVSLEDLNLATQMLRHNMQLGGEDLREWHCMVLSSANRHKALPEQYLCATVEDMLPHTASVAQDGCIVLLSAVSDKSGMNDTSCPILLPWLKDMNFRVGISTPFRDIFQAMDHYSQAVSTLQLGGRAPPGGIHLPV